METTLRAVRLLALTVWVGGLVFFAFVVAPVAFGRLPSPHEAGLVVGGTLRVLHGMGLVAGVFYVVASALASRRMGERWLRIGVACVVGMLVLTAWSQFGILPRMERDRVAAGGIIDASAEASGASADFDRLHRLSEKVEGIVLLLGIGAVVLAAGEPRRTNEAA